MTRYLKQRYFKLLTGFLIIVLSSIYRIPLQAQYDRLQEYQIKGAFLYNFTQFTEWPPAAFPAPDTPLVIGVLGKNPFGSFLRELVRDEITSGHPMVFRQYTSVKDVDRAHILFISNDFDIADQDIQFLSAEKHILTVSDDPRFTERGGIIRFFEDDNRIRFEINLQAARESDLVLSSKLLRLSRICCGQDP